VVALADYRTRADLADELARVTRERDQLRALLLADDGTDDERHAEMWRRMGRETADEARTEGWRAGYEAGARVLADTWPALVATVTRDGPSHDEMEARRYGPGGRAAFADPRPADRTGAQLVADARASWEAAGLDLGPVGMVHLSGAILHSGHQCVPACRAYRPGWYPPDRAAAILRTLPGNYAATIADLERRSAASPTVGNSQVRGA